jgi:hypothetical protein
MAKPLFPPRQRDSLLFASELPRSGLAEQPLAEDESQPPISASYVLAPPRRLGHSCLRLAMHADLARW